MQSDVREKLQALFEVGRAHWPAFEVPLTRFSAAVMGAAPSPAETPTWLDDLHAGDLYLVCGCLLGEARALAAFENQIIAPLAAELMRRRDGRLADDIVQELRTRMLGPQANGQPRLAAYHGRGPLARWVRVAAARVAVDLFRAQRPDSQGNVDANVDAIVDADVDASMALSDRHDPEMDLVERHSRFAFEAALREALSTMAARDATVLRLFYLENMPLARIADRYGVSQRSIQNWIVRARKHALLQTRACLAERWHLPDPHLADIESVTSLSIELNLRQILDRAENHKHG
ncbi:MAG TPA: sigma-70 family RNA polymerase sigma factor [Polyangia bacterium]